MKAVGIDDGSVWQGNVKKKNEQEEKVKKIAAKSKPIFSMDPFSVDPINLSKPSSLKEQLGLEEDELDDLDEEIAPIPKSQGIKFVPGIPLPGQVAADVKADEGKEALGPAKEAFDLDAIDFEEAENS